MVQNRVAVVTFANDCVAVGRSLLSSIGSRYLERSDGLRDLEEEEEADDGEQVGDGKDQFADEVRVVLRPERSLEVHVVVVDDVERRRRPADERRSEQHQHHVVVTIPHVTIVHLSAPATRRSFHQAIRLLHRKNVNKCHTTIKIVRLSSVTVWDREKRRAAHGWLPAADAER